MTSEGRETWIEDLERELAAAREGCNWWRRDGENSFRRANNAASPDADGGSDATAKHSPLRQMFRVTGGKSFRGKVGKKSADGSKAGNKAGAKTRKKASKHNPSAARKKRTSVEKNPLGTIPEEPEQTPPAAELTLTSAAWATSLGI